MDTVTLALALKKAKTYSDEILEESKEYTDEKTESNVISFDTTASDICEFTPREVVNKMLESGGLFAKIYHGSTESDFHAIAPIDLSVYAVPPSTGSYVIIIYVYNAATVSMFNHIYGSCTVSGSEDGTWTVYNPPV